MIRTTGKIIRVCFYAAVILIGVTFAASNRNVVDLAFYPIPYIVSLPMYLFIIVIFSLGILVGWISSRFDVLRFKRASKQSDKRIMALENELGTLRYATANKAPMIAKK